MGNASSHPSPESLVSECGEITCVFLPPNVTSLVQPMDQEVLENLKGRYKRQKLMLDLASPLSLLAHLTIKDAVLNLGITGLVQMKVRLE